MNKKGGSALDNFVLYFEHLEPSRLDSALSKLKKKLKLTGRHINKGKEINNDQSEPNH